jgi:hypothetical protein
MWAVVVVCDGSYPCRNRPGPDYRRIEDIWEINNEEKRLRRFLPLPTENLEKYHW